MATLYDFQKTAVSQLMSGKHIIISGVGSGKTAMALTWVAQKCRETGKDKVVVITTASKSRTCFIKGTKVSTPYGEKSIEDFSVGDMVMAYDGDNLCPKKVVNVIKHNTEKVLYRIDFGGCCNIIGTEDHPIYVGNGEYKEMKDIKKGDLIYGIADKVKRSKEKTRHSDGKVLQGEPNSIMFNMWKGNPTTNKGAKRPVVEKTDDVLFSRLLNDSKKDGEEKCLQEKDDGTISERNTLFRVWQKTFLRYNNNRSKENILPNWKNILFSGLSKKSTTSPTQEVFTDDDSRTKDKRRKSKSESFGGKEYPYEPSSNFIEPVNGRRVGVCGRFRRYLCSNRPSISREKSWDRDRRSISQYSKIYRNRCEKRQEVVPIRVENIQVLRQNTSRKNTVYCIEVEDAHNFFANGVLVHNCDFEQEAGVWCPSLLTSLSSFSVLSWHKLRAWVGANWRSLDEYVYILDEVQRAKAGVSSGMGRAFLKITKQTEDWAGFTGTPGDTWLSFYPYLQACDLVRNKTTFLNTYASIQTYKGYPEIVGWRNEDKLKQMWASISYAPDTQKVMSELPEQTHKVFTFKKPTAYNKVLKTRMNEAGEFLDTAGAMCAELRRQCFTKDKQEWVKDFVDGLESGCVFFYNFIKTGDMLEEIMQKMLPKDAKIWRIDGKHHDIPTAETIGKKDMVLCQWQSGSEGLNLHFLHYMVIVEANYSYSLSIQGRGRIRRIGQKNPQFYFYLKTEGTIEEAIYKALHDKSDFAEDKWCLREGIINEKD